MKKLSLVAASLLVLGTASAFAQTPTPSPSTPSGGSQDGATNQQPCSASDAAKIRNGQQPSTPCRSDSTSGSGSSSSGSSAGGAGGSPTPMPGQ